jgi:2-keto-3-deoxy-L-rhamnonate aldolase RhmA
MKITRNLAKQRLEQGQLVLGLGLRQTRGADIGLIARTCGFDFLFLDCEHNSMDLAAAADIAVAALGQDITPIVRATGKEPFHSTRMLDNGAQGAIIPHVNDSDEARQIVAALRYPPLGHRSLSTASPLVAFEKISPAEFTRAANEETLIVAMLENANAISEVDAIAAVPGIDALMIGTTDLCCDMGLAGEYGHARIGDAYSAMIEACRNHGKHAGMAGIRDDRLMKQFIEMGVGFVLVATDLQLMMEAGQARTGSLRSNSDLERP